MKKLLSAFIAFEDSEEPKPDAPAGSTDDILANTQALLAELGTTADVEAAADPVVAASPAPVTPIVNVQEGQAFADMYAAGGLTKSPFTAEQFLDILKGLSAIPEEHRLPAVRAMDAADDSWSAADVIADVEGKTSVLGSVLVSLRQTVTEAETTTAQKNKGLDEYQTAATEELRKQIAALEATLQEEIASVATQKAQNNAKLQATKESCARETARVTAEMTRLGQIPIFLGHTPSPGE